MRTAELSSALFSSLCRSLPSSRLTNELVRNRKSWRQLGMARPASTATAAAAATQPATYLHACASLCTQQHLQFNPQLLAILLWEAHKVGGLCTAPPSGQGNSTGTTAASLDTISGQLAAAQTCGLQLNRPAHVAAIARASRELRLGSPAAAAAQLRRVGKAAGAHARLLLVFQQGVPPEQALLTAQLRIWQQQQAVSAWLGALPGSPQQQPGGVELPQELPLVAATPDCLQHKPSAQCTSASLTERADQSVSQ